jgi:hypothetical protein
MKRSPLDYLFVVVLALVIQAQAFAQLKVVETKPPLTGEVDRIELTGYSLWSVAFHTSGEWDVRIDCESWGYVDYSIGFWVDVDILYSVELLYGGQSLAASGADASLSRVNSPHCSWSSELNAALSVTFDGPSSQTLVWARRSAYILAFAAHQQASNSGTGYLEWVSGEVPLYL